MRTFSEIDSFSAEKQFENQIKQKIESESKEYVLGVDEEEYKEYLISEYTLTPLTVYEESEIINEPRISKESVSSRRGNYEYERDVYTFTISYTYSGSKVLFKIRPSSWKMTSYEISIYENTVSFKFKMHEQDPEKFKRQKSGAFRAAFANLENVNNFANSWNLNVKGIVNREFKKRKEKFLKENDFFAAINIATNKDTESIFSVPSIRKADIPQPKVDSAKEFASIPTMSSAMYSDILKVIYDAGKSMEKKPALYIDKDEEGLRDQFLFILETRYVGTTATGETFNKKGKTDIILKYAADNTNLFVAECKFWKGASEFHEAINQLFDRYLTWRDSKTALILFVKNKDFTRVLESVKEEAEKHKYFSKKNGHNGESSFSFLFKLSGDNDKTIFLEIILFHFDQKK